MISRESSNPISASETRIRVCVATTAFPRWKGDGQAAFGWEAVRAIARQGIDIRVVAMHSPGAKHHEVVEGVEILRPAYWLPERWEALRKEGAGGLPATWRKHPWLRLQLIPFMLVHTLAVMRCARSCDLVHAHWTLSAATAHLGRWMHDCPVLVTVHGSDIFQVTRHPIGNWFTRTILRRCERITAPSHALADAALTSGAPAERLRVIPDGVDTSYFRPPEDAQREEAILYVGSFIERKGLAYLLAAMPQILRLFPMYRLVLAGEGPQEAQIRQMAADMGISSQVVFLGFQTQEQVRNLMQRARVLVLPSTEEGLGVVLLEALSCGTPVVASRVGGIQEVVSPEVGILVPPADPSGLAEALCRMLADKQFWANASHQARERAVTHYDWQYIAAQFVSLYQEVIRSRTQGPHHPS